MKAYAKQQDEIAHIKKFMYVKAFVFSNLAPSIDDSRCCSGSSYSASAGTYANLVKQAKSKQKVRSLPQGLFLLPYFSSLSLTVHLFTAMYRSSIRWRPPVSSSPSREARLSTSDSRTSPSFPLPSLPSRTSRSRTRVRRRTTSTRTSTSVSTWTRVSPSSETTGSSAFPFLPFPLNRS
jgi:hypothetical protein